MGGAGVWHARSDGAEEAPVSHGAESPGSVLAVALSLQLPADADLGESK